MKGLNLPVLKSWIAVTLPVLRSYQRKKRKKKKETEPTRVEVIDSGDSTRAVIMNSSDNKETEPARVEVMDSGDNKETEPTHVDIVQELCESRGGRPGLSVLTSLLVSVDVKNY